jgi:hypothetical protein
MPISRREKKCPETAHVFKSSGLYHIVTSGKAIQCQITRRNERKYNVRSNKAAVQTA